mmetsp:Transcript_18029/g.35892  ORF Transcript_18029/g.35892 Transcript_18029/m.35892 type:complete len:498 (+) Transcript_18029:164-1657(+)
MQSLLSWINNSNIPFRLLVASLLSFSYWPLQLERFFVFAKIPTDPSPPNTPKTMASDRFPLKQVLRYGNVETIDSTTFSNATHVANQPNDRAIRDVILKETRGYDIFSPDNVGKRSDYLSWNDYFMAVAYLSGQRSKDPHPTRKAAGACIVDTMGRIVGIGYDGFPRGCSDDCLPWASNDDVDGTETLPILHTKDPYLCRAEINAILNKCSADVIGGRIYVPYFPGNESAKFIIQSGIQEVIYLEDRDEDSDSSRASRMLFQVSGVKMTKMEPSVPSIRIDLGVPLSSPIDPSCSCCKPTGLCDNNERNEDDMEKYLGLLKREASFDPFCSKVKKKSDYLSWDEYFMGVAFLSAKRSKDPNTQVGACIVDSNKCIIGIGYNGFPRGCSDDHLPWARSASCELQKKYPYVVHAEVNAILNKCSASVSGATIYVALFPCNECAKVIIQSGIKEVVYLDDFYHYTDGCRASRIMFKMGGVKLRHYKPDHKEILINMDVKK